MSNWDTVSSALPPLFCAFENFRRFTWIRKRVCNCETFANGKVRQYSGKGGQAVERHVATRPVTLLWGPFNLRLALYSPLMVAPQPLLAFLNKDMHPPRPAPAPPSQAPPASWYGTKNPDHRKRFVLRQGKPKFPLSGRRLEGDGLSRSHFVYLFLNKSASEIWATLSCNHLSRLAFHRATV